MSIINEKENTLLEGMILSKKSSNILKEIENVSNDIEKNTFVAQLLTFFKVLLEKKDREAHVALKKMEATWSNEQLTTCCQILFYCYAYSQYKVQKRLDDANNLTRTLEEPTNSVEKSFQKYVRALCQWVVSANQDVQTLDIAPFWKKFTEKTFEYSQEYKAELARRLKETRRIMAEKKAAEELQRIEDERKRIAEQKEREQKLAEEQKRKEKRNNIIKIILFVWLLPLTLLEGATYTAEFFTQTSPIGSIWGLWLYITVAVLCMIVAGISLQLKKVGSMILSHLIFWGAFLVTLCLSIGLGSLIQSFCMETFLWGGAILIGVSVVCVVLGIRFLKESIDAEETAVGVCAILPGVFFITELVVFQFWGDVMYWTIWTCFFAILSVVLAFILLANYINKNT